MIRMLGVLLVTGVTGLVANPTPADAQGNETEWAIVKCMNAAVESCNDDFPPGDYRNTAIRGWCYMIRSAMCDGSSGKDFTQVLEVTK